MLKKNFSKASQVNPVKLISIMLLLITAISSFATQATTTVPDVLKPWVPWVEKGHEVLKCPFFNKSDYKEAKNHVCAWPGTLRLNAKDNGATFNQSWQVIEESWLSLPGDSYYWPQGVTVNNKPVAVLNRRGKPEILLAAGNYQISGRFDWQALPESLVIPKTFALVTLKVNEETMVLPKLVKGELWFGEQQVKQTKRDSATIYVKRRLTDGAYLALKTQITVVVSGKRREAQIGKVLPPGFELTGISGDLSAFLDGEGILHAKLKPGSWTMTVDGYALPTQLSWQRPEKTLLWPDEEIWAFDARENYRAGKLTGAKVIDATLADLPPDWQDLPTYVMQTADVLDYKISHRGKPNQLENRLYLNRDLWLSFDHNQYAFKDTISGTMVNDWRFSMNSPYLLTSGEDKDGSVLVTSQKDNERGVENRFPQVDFKARGTINNTSTLPITGWDNHFESVSLNLNLPPGTRLFAAFGADSVSLSWWGTWSIWSSFIVLFSAVLAGRAINPLVGVITGIALVLIFQEHNAPIVTVCNALASIALYKYQPFERLKPFVRGYLAFSLIGVTAAILYFCAGQIRSTVYPQLEQRQYASNAIIGHFNDPGILSHSVNQVDQLLEQVRRDRVSEDNIEQRTEAEFSSNQLRKSKAPEQKQFVKDRYQSDALMQAGAGIPDWRWHQHQIDWSSPVAKNQQTQILVMSQAQTALFKSLGIVLILLWLYTTLKSTLGGLITAIRIQPVAAVILVGLLSPVGIEQAQAQTQQLPNQHLLKELEARVTEPPKCAALCATINNLHVSVDGNQLELKMQVHTLSDTAIALPFSSYWQPQRVIVNGKDQTRLSKRNGWTYFHLKKGLFEVNVSGAIAPVDVFQLQFAEQPKQIKLAATSAWDIVGSEKNRLTGNTLEFIATIQKQQTDDVQSSRYAVKPFVRITRRLSFDQTWTVQTSVSRIAPTNGSISVMIPLLSGEHITSGDRTVKDGQVAVTIAAGRQDTSWTSTLERQQELSLTANNQGQAFERWQIISSPSWHIVQSGLPMVLDEQNDQSLFVADYYPYDGETLMLDITRPVAVKGHILAIDMANLTLDQGSRTSQVDLEFNYRSTRGGEHTIELPKGYLLNDVLSNDRTLNLQPDGNKLTLPISPGSHTVQLKLRANTEESTLLSAPAFNLNAPLSNITTEVFLGQERWVLWTSGPLQGPAVIYWGELLVFVLLALLLSRYPFSPLGTVGWLMLGFGLSFNNWSALIMTAIWFAALTMSKYRPKDLNHSTYNLSQLLLMILSVATLLTLISVIPTSLLGRPDMGIDGYNSWGNQLQWFADKSDGQLPDVSVISLPILIYKGLMLLWVLWLSFSLLSWIKWAWRLLGEQGFFHAKPLQPVKDEAAPEEPAKDDDKPKE